MVEIDSIIFGEITKGDFSSPSSEFVTPPPLFNKEGQSATGVTPPHKTPAQWRGLEASRDILDRRGKRAHVPRACQEFWEPDARLVAKQVDLQLMQGQGARMPYPPSLHAHSALRLTDLPPGVRFEPSALDPACVHRVTVACPNPICGFSADASLTLPELLQPITVQRGARLLGSTCTHASCSISFFELRTPGPRPDGQFLLQCPFNFPALPDTYWGAWEPTAPRRGGLCSQLEVRCMLCAFAKPVSPRLANPADYLHQTSGKDCCGRLHLHFSACALAALFQRARSDGSAHVPFGRDLGRILLQATADQQSLVLVCS